MLEENHRLPKFGVDIFWIGGSEGETEDFTVYFEPTDNDRLLALGSRALRLAKAVAQSLKEQGYILRKVPKNDGKDDIYYNNDGFSFEVDHSHLPKQQVESFEAKFAKDLETTIKSVSLEYSEQHSKRGKKSRQESAETELHNTIKQILDANPEQSHNAITTQIVQAAVKTLLPEKSKRER